jgi:hypothetical protein
MILFSQVHKHLNWAGKGVVSNFVAADLRRNDSQGQSCLQEKVSLMLSCSYSGVVLSIIMQRINVSFQFVDYKPTKDDFVHTL